jgi:prepilin peptidase CpaA
MTVLAPVMQALLALVVVTAGAYDLRYRRIPNWLTLTGLVLGLVMNTFLYGIAGLRTAGLGFGLAFLVYLVLFSIRAVRGGDVKLGAAVGTLVGPANWFVIFLLTAVVGALLGLALVIARGRLRKTLWNVSYILSEFVRFRAPYLTREELDVTSEKATRLPHAFSMLLGCLLFIAAGAIWGPERF